MARYGNFDSFEEAVSAQLEMVLAAETGDKGAPVAGAEHGFGDGDATNAASSPGTFGSAGISNTFGSAGISNTFGSANSVNTLNIANTGNMGNANSAERAESPTNTRQMAGIGGVCNAAVGRGCHGNGSDSPKGRIVSLASGSRANCTLVELDGTRILIDFGLSCRMAKKVLGELGVELSGIDAVFITHEHADHVAGLVTLFKNYSVPVHMTEPSFISYTRGKGFEYRGRITVHPVEYTERVGALTVTSCHVDHDSAACVSFLVEGNGFSFCSCTDLGCVTERLLQHICRAENVILESNHDLTLLSVGSYPDDLKRRIRGKHGHLSNDQCGSVLVRLVNGGVKRVLLAHVSAENNTRDIVLRSAMENLERVGAQLGFLDVAERISPVRLL
ncbi:MAG: MBL fold metallo-hydrolase [Clostridia bacterium]|nr:MBL fold metallo-hydrolase [Clostridia bacterium]